MSAAEYTPQQAEHPLFQELWELLDTYVSETDSGDMRPLVHTLLATYSIKPLAGEEVAVEDSSLREQVEEGVASGAGAVLDRAYFTKLRRAFATPGVTPEKVLATAKTLASDEQSWDELTPATQEHLLATAVVALAAAAGSE